VILRARAYLRWPVSVSSERHDGLEPTQLPQRRSGAATLDGVIVLFQQVEDNLAAAYLAAGGEAAKGRLPDLPDQPAATSE